MTGSELEERKFTLSDSLKNRAANMKKLRLEEVCILLVDISSSMHDATEEGMSKIDAVRQSIPNLYAATHRVAYGMIGFNEDAHEIQSLTSNFGLIIGQAESISPRGSTNISAAMRVGLVMINNKDTERKRMILLSDGSDNIEQDMVEECIIRCQEEKVVVDTIAFGRDADELRLREIAKRTGGVFYSAKSVRKLAEAYKKLNFDVRYLTCSTINL